MNRKYDVLRAIAAGPMLMLMLGACQPKQDGVGKPGGDAGVPAPELKQPATGDYFYSFRKRIPLDVASDRIGVLARPEAGEGAVREFAQSAKLRLIGSFPNGIHILGIGKALPRPELVARAREVARQGSKVIANAGLVVTPPEAEAPMLVTDRFIVQLRGGASRSDLEALNRDHAVRILMENPLLQGQFLLTATPDSRLDALALSNRYEEHGRFVEYAHPDFIKVTLLRQVLNDTFFGNQWHHDNTGQSAGTVDADVDSPEAWAITQGAAATVIAVIDGGFDLAHPDLAGNLWVNPNEVANGVDDADAGAFVDDINGWDFTGCDVAMPGPACGDANPQPQGFDPNHGTAVAGKAAAIGNNNRGVSGSCPGCRLMMLALPNSDFAQGLAFNYAQNQGAGIVTNSWGFAIGTPCTTNLCTAINNAAAAGRGGLGSVVLFAMNNPNVNDCNGAAPDISSLASVIAVSRSSNRDRFDFSGFGNCMDVLAPSAGLQTVPTGRGTLWITTTDRQGAVGYNNAAAPGTCPLAGPNPPPVDARDYTNCFNGTSSSTPLTAGVVGLILSANTALTRQQVQQVLQDTTDRIEDSTGAYAEAIGFSAPAGGNATHGWGRVNAFEAVRVVAATAAGGRNNTDVFIRDNRLDWGNTQQPSNVTFEATRGFIPHYTSVDIKVDAPPYAATPTAATFDALVHENPVTGAMNRAYVRVRNRGGATAASVSVKLQWADAGPGLPGLPADFWSAWPADPASTVIWHPMPCTANPASTVCTVSNLAYSGATAAGCPGRAQPACAGATADAAQVVAFDFQGPAVGPSGINHFCLFAVLDSPADRARPLAQPPVPADFVPDALTPIDNNVTHRNIVVDDSGRSTRFEYRFAVRNPFERAVRARLVTTAPREWTVTLDRFGNGATFPLEPKQEVIVGLRVTTPSEGAAGIVDVRQHTLLGEQEVIGGMQFHIRPPPGVTLLPAAHASVNGVALVGDPYTGSTVNYLSDGSGYGAKAGDTFSFAPIQLPQGATIRRLKCVVRDDSPQGYVQITLIRGPINAADGVLPLQLIAHAVTWPATDDANFIEVSGGAQAALAVVNNANYGYLLRADFLDAPAPGGRPALMVRGCSVEYAP